MLIEEGAVVGEGVKQPKKPEWSISSKEVRVISPSSPTPKVGSQAKIKKRKTKEKDSTSSSRNTKNDTQKKTPSSPLKNQLGKAKNIGASVSSSKRNGKSAKKSSVPQFVVLSGATAVKSDGLGNLGSTTRRSMSHFPSQSSDSANKQE